MLSNYKTNINQLLIPLGKSLHWINPNLLTLIGIIPYLLFYYFLQNQNFGYAAIALVFSAIDLVDGVIARTNNKVTSFGAFFDSTIDRVSDFLVIWAFYAAGLSTLNLTVVLLVTTYLISYMRSRAELAAGGQISFAKGIIERPERLIFIFAVVILQKFGFSFTYELLYLLTIFSLVTVLQRFYYAYTKLK